MATILIHSIRQIAMAHTQPPDRVAGAAMSDLAAIDNGFILIENGIIRRVGTMAETLPTADTTIDATGRYVLPTWCDSHTHLVFAGSRELEFIDKVRGLTYEQIAQKGGGILNSARRLQGTPEADLVQSALARIQEIVRYGTGAVEIKSGYGLTVEAELKMLRVIRQLKELSPIPIKATFLGAHALPLEYKQDKQGYINLVINTMMPQVAGEGLADYIDVFCEKGFFSVEDTDRILNAAARYGLRPKIHANQLDYSGGVQIGVQHRALSVDHLEHAGEAEIESLLGSDTMPTLLPSAAFFLRMPYPPARQMIDAGLPVCLATDFNPGSSPSGKMPFVLTLACLYMKMLPEEAIAAATLNGAYAMDLHTELGTVTVGKKAHLIITKPIPSLAYIPYAFGSDVVENVVLGNQII